MSIVRKFNFRQFRWWTINLRSLSRTNVPIKIFISSSHEIQINRTRRQCLYCAGNRINDWGNAITKEFIDSAAEHIMPLCCFVSFYLSERKCVRCGVYKLSPPFIHFKLLQMTKSELCRRTKIVANDWNVWVVDKKRYYHLITEGLNEKKKTYIFTKYVVWLNWPNEKKKQDKKIKKCSNWARQRTKNNSENRHGRKEKEKEKESEKSELIYWYNDRRPPQQY